VEPPGQRGLQVLLKELAVPAFATLEVHIDTMSMLLGHAANISETKAKVIHSLR
jgi:hypothetical protein